MGLVYELLYGIWNETLGVLDTLLDEKLDLIFGTLYELLYEILDEIERAAIRDKQDPSEIMELLRATYPNYGDDQLRFWIERFFRLWCRNQWQRERYAPSFHVDDENLDPKTWCRFPILSGGFERELAVLRDSKEK